MYKISISPFFTPSTICSFSNGVGISEFKNFALSNPYISIYQSYSH